MRIEELEELKKRMQAEARKWVTYLEPMRTEEAERELARKLLETWLEGHSGVA